MVMLNGNWECVTTPEQACSLIEDNMGKEFADVVRKLFENLNAEVKDRKDDVQYLEAKYDFLVKEIKETIDKARFFDNA